MFEQRKTETDMLTDLLEKQKDSINMLSDKSKMDDPDRFSKIKYVGHYSTSAREWN